MVEESIYWITYYLIPLGIEAALIALTAIYYWKTRRPVLLWFLVTFCIQTIPFIVQLVIDYPHLAINLYELGLHSNEVVVIMETWGYIFFTIGLVSSAFLLISVIKLCRSFGKPKEV